MNYQQPELRQLLAGEYVLGTLHGRARRRFETLLKTNRLLQREVTAWEARLNSLNHIEELTPPSRVWRAIKTEVEYLEAKPESVKKRLSFWQALAGLASLASVAMLLIMLNLGQFIQPKGFEANFVALINDANTQPLWLIRADTDKQLLALEVLNAPPEVSLKDYELWLLPENAQAPISLGLLPQSGIKQVALLKPEQLPSAAGIAVSIEPQGGSPTGAPTGPVVYQGKFSPKS